MDMMYFAKHIRSDSVLRLNIIEIDTLFITPLNYPPIRIRERVSERFRTSVRPAIVHARMDFTFRHCAGAVLGLGVDHHEVLQYSYNMYCSSSDTTNIHTVCRTLQIHGAIHPRQRYRRCTDAFVLRAFLVYRKLYRLSSSDITSACPR